MKIEWAKPRNRGRLKGCYAFRLTQGHVECLQIVAPEATRSFTAMLVRNARKEVRSHFNQPCQRNPHGPLAPAGPHVRKESH